MGLQRAVGPGLCGERWGVGRKTRSHRSQKEVAENLPRELRKRECRALQQREGRFGAACFDILFRI